MIRQVVIIDLDGICFDPTDRLERCKDDNSNINWDRAFSNEEVIKDKPIEGAETNVRQIAERYDIVYLTGRSTKCDLSTRMQLWLRNNFPIGYLAMRKENDVRPDYVIKKEWIEQLQNSYLNAMLRADFIAVIDDDWGGKLHSMYEEKGIPHFYSFEELFASDVWQKETGDI